MQGDQPLRKGQKLPGVGGAVPDTRKAVDRQPVISGVPSDLWPQGSTGHDPKPRGVALELRAGG